MMSHRRQLTAVAVFVLAMLAFACRADAQARGRRPAPAGGNVQLPHNVTDSQGNQWMIYPTGWIQMQGNQPLYSQGAVIQINGNQPNARNNSAKLDDKTGEVIFENMNAGGFTVTRRILIDKENAYARYIDIIKNNQQQEVTANVMIQSNFNFGVDQATTINDPRRKENTIAWSAGNGNGRAVLEMYAGKGSKIVPNFNFQQGNTTVSGTMALPIPGGKEVAIMHVHAVVGTPEQGADFVAQLREGRMMRALAPDLRKKIVNFVTAQGFIGDRELLRGELFDVVEIRGGDQVRGTIKEPAFKLATFYGDVELPANRVVGILNVGDFRPRQLIVTTDGEIFGGKLAKQTIDLELTSGQTTQIPLSQVTRAGYRKRADEPEEWTFDKPFVALRSGERVGVEMPTTPIDVVTRYGPLKLDPKAIAAVVFQTEEHGVHEIRLTDGSKFAGLVAAAEFEMKLGGATASTQPSARSASAAQTVKFPSSAIARIQFVVPPDDVDPSESPTLDLANDDILVGTLSGNMKLDTAFDTLTLNAAEIKKLTRGNADAGALDVQVTLWDSSIVSGQLQDPTLKCQLASGVALTIPIALLDEYNQPQPAPAATMVERIKAAVAQLNASEWKARDRAEAELTAMGPVVTGVLKQIRPDQPPEAQQRIDQILSAVAKKK
ncbi:MAG: hypothetical protein QOF78_1265 [Phycisphaerales bacterium]|jgi:hypothetical protein|nr:hypothetical protein [Phycisphaerales bacterium]